MTLSPRHAKLRAEAMAAVTLTLALLDGSMARSVLYSSPKTALRRIAAAEEHLRKAKRALRAWARSKA